MSTPAGGGGGGGGGGLIGAAVAVVLVLLLLNTGQCTFTVGGNSPRAPVAFVPTVPRASYAPIAPTVRSRGTLEDEINRALGRPQLEPGVGYSVSTTASPYDAPKQNCQVLASALSADGMYTLVRRACPR